MFSRYVVSQVKHNSYFLVGLGIGLWLALATVPLEEEVVACEAPVAAAATDEFEPQREERPLGPAGQAGRSVQRPRYYSTELGMRGGLLAGVLSSEDVLETRAAALNQTAARLQPALRFFITASALQAAPGRANVVGFTDTREMLKPFHALKYLADNYLEEYDFFFLVSDTSFVNSRRLTELVSKLSVSQDIYMGTVADDDTHYCTLEGGILLSNSVLRAVHGELDWCVRNSYSPHHHENLGRCVLHAAHLPCAAAAQGENYVSMRIEGVSEPEGGVESALVEALADAVVAQPALRPEHFYQLHAFVSRVYLERAARRAASARARAARSARRHPRGFRNASWPPALRDDAGLAPAPPPSRFDHLRWTRFNLTHAFMPDEHRALAPLSSAYKQAVDLIVEEVSAWAARRWGATRGVALEEGAWCWEPPRALRYRLLLRVPRDEGPGALLQVEAARALGAARLAPARYVTESARVLLLLPLPAPHAAALPAFLRRYEAVCLQRDTNTALYVVVVGSADSPAEGEAALAAAREALRALGDKHRGAALEALAATRGAAPRDAGEAELQRDAARAALAAVLPRVARDALLLLALPHMEFTEDFLNRVRMNTIAGEQWFLPLPFARFSQYAHPRFADAGGARPALDTGRFAPRAAPLVLAAHRRDYEDAAAAWQARGGAADADAAAVLAASPLRALRAPEPALLLAPRGAPCAAAAPACLRRARARAFADLQLGARHALAKLLLQTQAELA